ncbi:MAG TPA: Ku protein [Acidimicrobiales bacterium]|jgi:DNA end-binding protein Ku|nr:Ku protein [Acidimicrobiales bacterium]
MARAIWSGSISFGLVNIPVKLYGAVSRKNVAFNQIDKRTGSRIKQKRVSAVDGEEVPYDEIVKGYELASGEYVTVSDDELSALDPEAARTIDIEEFVDLADIDPIYYDSAYYLVPDATTAKPYKLLATAMEQSQKVGIARFVMRTKQYLAAVRPKDGHLLLSTMVYDDEVVKPAEIGGFDVLDRVDVGDREVAMAEQLIESLGEPFTPEKHRDTYRDAVLELIERKAAGETEFVAAPAPPSTDKVIDLMAALEASVKAAKDARSRHPSGRADAEEPAAEKPAAKKRGKVAVADAAVDTAAAETQKAPRKRKTA